MSDRATVMPEAATADSTEHRTAKLGWWARVSFGCVRAFLRGVLTLTGLRGLYLLCQFFGTLEYLVNHKRRRRVAEIMQRVFGRNLAGAERRRLVRAHIMRERCDKVFYLVADLLSSAQVLSRFDIVNRHLLDEGLARGKGVFVMTCHQGAQHVNGLAMSTLKYRVGAVRDANEGPLRTYIQSLWTRKHPELPPPRIIFANTFIRDVYRLYKENFAMGSALDVSRVRDPRLKTVPVQIYGETRQFLTGPLQIALRCGATVLQGFVIAREDFVYHLELLGPMVEPPGTPESSELLADVMQRYADNVAEYARRYPDQVTRA